MLSNHGEESRVVDNVSFWRRGENHEKKKVQSHHMIESSSSPVQQEKGRGGGERNLSEKTLQMAGHQTSKTSSLSLSSAAEREKEEITPSNGGQTESPIIIFLSFQTLPLSSFSRPDRLRR